MRLRDDDVAVDVVVDVAANVVAGVEDADERDD